MSDWMFETIEGLPLTSFSFMVAATVVFVVTHAYIEYFRITFKGADMLCIYHNRWYGVLNWLWTGCLFYFYWTDYTSPSFDTMVCHPRKGLKFAFYLYYLSKLWEFLDVYLVLLKGGFENMHPHFRFHHSTTLSATWCALYSNTYNFPVMTTNIVLHAIMYLRFGNIPIVPESVFRLIFRFLGTLQLVLGLASGFAILLQRWKGTPCGTGGLVPELYMMWIILSLCGLFYYELKFPKNPSKKQN